MLTLAVPRYFNSVDRTKENVLREDLFVMRDAIDKYYADKGHYPNALNDLVAQKYLRSIPVDPFTQTSNGWLAEPPAATLGGGIANVRSAASAVAHDGSPLKDW
jgi:general secretion pathway protein G